MPTLFKNHLYFGAESTAAKIIEEMIEIYYRDPRKSELPIINVTTFISNLSAVILDGIDYSGYQNLCKLDKKEVRTQIATFLAVKANNYENNYELTKGANKTPQKAQGVATNQTDNGLVVHTGIILPKVLFGDKVILKKVMSERLQALCEVYKPLMKQKGYVSLRYAI